MMQKKGDLYLQDYVSHVRWYITIRWVYLIALAVAGIGGQLAVKSVYPTLSIDVVFLIIGVLMNAVFYVLARRERKDERYFETLAIAQVLMDILFATYAIYFYGGAESKLLLLYAIPLFTAGALLGRTALAVALVAIFLSYDSILVLDAYGWAAPHGYRLTSNVVVGILFYNALFVLTGIIGIRSLEITTARIRRQYTEQLALNTAKDEFVSLASHQLRTPATAVKQYLGMLKSNYAGSVSARQMNLLKRAYDANERQIGIVNDILNLSHIETGTIKISRTELEVGVLLERIVNEQQFRASERKQYIHLKRPVADVMATVDAEKLTLVMNYLIDNALKYSDDNSKVEVRFRKLGSSLTISVRDFGVGIAKKDIQKLYKKFSRIPNLYSDSGGTGLGLYVSKTIIEMHGGRIKVESEIGSGTTFIITLPAQQNN